jgi:hypothetical protein
LSIAVIYGLKRLNCAVQTKVLKHQSTAYPLSIVLRKILEFDILLALKTEESFEERLSSTGDRVE